MTTIEIKPLWIERVMYGLFLVGLMFGCVSLASSRASLSRDNQALQAEIDVATYAHGKAVQKAAHCEYELIQKAAQLQFVDRWLSLAAEGRSYGNQEHAE